MYGRRVAVAAVLCAWVGVGALCALALEGDPSNPADVALKDALQELAASAMERDLGGGRRVGDFMKASGLPTDQGDVLLAGAREYPPRRAYGDGVYEIRVGINVDKLRANLREIKEAYYDTADKTFADEKFDGLGGGADPIMATGFASDVTIEAGKRIPGIPGWDAVSVRQRVAAERAAYDVAAKKVVAEARALPVGADAKVGDLFAGAAEARKALDEFLAGIRAESKAYLAEGGVEVRVVLDVTRVVERIEAINDDIPEKGPKVAKETLAAMKKAAADKRLSGVGYARADGKPFDPAGLQREPVEIDFGTAPTIPIE